MLFVAGTSFRSAGLQIAIEDTTRLSIQATISPDGEVLDVGTSKMLDTGTSTAKLVRTSGPDTRAASLGN